jgi:hypothetical protein
MPTDRLIKKYKLMPATKDKVVACTQISVDKELIDTFINEYKADFQLYV